MKNPAKKCFIYKFKTVDTKTAIQLLSIKQLAVKGPGVWEFLKHVKTFRKPTQKKTLKHFASKYLLQNISSLKSVYEMKEMINWDFLDPNMRDLVSNTL